MAKSPGFTITTQTQENFYKQTASCVFTARTKTLNSPKRFWNNLWSFSLAPKLHPQVSLTLSESVIELSAITQVNLRIGSIHQLLFNNLLITEYYGVTPCNFEIFSFAPNFTILHSFFA